MAKNVSKYFWWAQQLNRVVWVPFWWAIMMVIVLFIPFLRVWWWVFFPLFLSIELRTLYLWWIRWDYNYAKIKWIMLEVITPKEILTPLKAMEDVFAVMWGPLYGPSNWREIWCEGAGEASMSWEIASFEGVLHFYIRVQSEHRLSLETVLYSHYPELEIHEVPDYTRTVPQNIPSEEWDVYGEDFILGKNPAFPIKTYEKFFEPQGEKIAAEEKRIDPISSLLELMSKLGPGEQFWMQFTISSEQEPEWIAEGKKLANKIAKHPEKKNKTFLEELYETFYHIIAGPSKEGFGESASYSWMDLTKTEEGERELLLTPGEREMLLEVETKLKKPIFRATIRGVYVAKRENWHSGHRILPRSYFSHFQTENLNYLRFSIETRPKTHYIFRRRIPYLRTRRMFRNYVLRFPPFFPDKERVTAMLNPEELATIYHFPIKITGLTLPSMPRVDSKKGGPPPNLPM